jgi:hypothetical protein
MSRGARPWRRADLHDLLPQAGQRQSRDRNDLTTRTALSSAALRRIWQLPIHQLIEDCQALLPGVVPTATMIEASRTSQLGLRQQL